MDDLIELVNLLTNEIITNVKMIVNMRIYNFQHNEEVNQQTIKEINSLIDSGVRNLKNAYLKYILNDFNLMYKILNRTLLLNREILKNINIKQVIFMIQQKTEKTYICLSKVCKFYIKDNYAK